MAASSRYQIVSLDIGDYATLLDGYSYPLYFAAWWLEVVLPADERLCIACYDAERCLAIFVARQIGAQVITPPYCQYAGILFLEDGLSSYERQCITEAFHRDLAPFSHYSLSYSSFYKDWLPLYWLGYRQTTRYNYVWPVADLSSADLFRQAISSSQRKNLRATERAGFTYLPNVSLDEVGDILARTASYKGYKSDLPLMLQLIERGLELGISQVVGVVNSAGEVAMVAFWVEHQGVAYLIGEGTDRERGGKYQLKIFMLMHYILQIRSRIREIDFEGSMLEPIAKIYQALGAEQHSYMTITKGWRYHPLVLWYKLLAKWSKI